MTEAEILVMLRERHNKKAGNGDQWAFATHVRNAAGFDASRTADAIAMHLWPSRGLELHGFEVKVTRADWQRELVKPEKAEAFAGLLDRWWLVVSDEKIIEAGELPPTWGLLVVRGGRVVCKKDAPRLRPATPDLTLPPRFGRSFLAALLRSSNKASASNEELTTEREAARAEARRSVERELEAERARREQAEEIIKAFGRESGVSMSAAWRGRDPEAVGRALRLVLDGNDAADRLQTRLEGLRRQAAATVEAIDAALEGDFNRV